MGKDKTPEWRLHDLAKDAMQGMLGNTDYLNALQEDNPNQKDSNKLISKASYDLAQEMIKEGERRKK